MYIRKTKDIYKIQGYYSSQYGYETVNTEDNRKDAKRSLKEYRENENYSFRMIKKREKI
jgi:hypothetical protein